MSRLYEMVIGLEVHVELSTKSKIFCACSTAFGAVPNTQVCPVCLGMPGALPVLNRRVLEYAVRVGVATHCSITPDSRFDRKNYFYPDNPTAYQISQYEKPIATSGYVDIFTDSQQSQTKRIRIHEMHMEEDAGKLLHDEITGMSLVDYNRKGVPLIEIVSEPDMRSADEVIAYLEKLRLLVQYLGVSDAKLQEGSLRADVNLSVRPVGCEQLGTRTEMKNLNSFRAISRAIAAEFDRQVALLEAGEKVVQETRRWDDAKGCSFSMRSKEEVQDYRYFPEPDLGSFQVSPEWVEQIRDSLPELQDAKCRRYVEQYGLPRYDAEILTGNCHLAELFEQTVACGAGAKEVSNWMMGELMRLLREQNREPELICFSPEHFADLLHLVEVGTINRTVAKQVFEVMFAQDVEPERYVAEQGLGLVQDSDALRQAVQKVLSENPRAVEDFRSGKTKVIGFLVGQTMRRMQDRADAEQVRRLLQEALEQLL